MWLDLMCFMTSLNIKVLLMAVLVALVFRKPVDSDSPEVDMERIKDAAQKFGNDPARSYMSKNTL